MVKKDGIAPEAVQRGRLLAFKEGAAVAKYDEATKQKALAIAESAGPAEASRATGIPAGTIRSWMHRLQRNGSPQRNNPATQRETQKMRALQAQVVEQAVQEAGEYIADRLKGLADGLYRLAEEGLQEVRGFMRSSPDPDRDSAAWLRALVGAMHYGIQDAQLLSGKPTARPEAVNRHEYDITQRIIADPEAVQLAHTLLRRAAGSDTSRVCLDSEQ